VAKTNHRPLGDQECHEFIAAVLQDIFRGVPPAAGMMYSSLSGWRSMKFFARQKTSHFPSGESFGK